MTIDAVAVDDPELLEAELIALGAHDTAIAGRFVSARLPIASIPSLENVVPLKFARQALSKTNAGQVTSQGDHVMRSDLARNTFEVDGTGVTVGVLSDSFNCLGGFDADKASGDLPASVEVTQELSGCSSGSDEGRAMLQIVHDVAPGAALSFATYRGGLAVAANNIRALRDAGAKVIVDDFIYFVEPMFQDGVIAQAVDEVAASGVSYFSAAGNEGRFGYDHAFVPGQFISGAGVAHNFGGTILQRISGPSGSQFRIVLQWDSPFFSVSGPPGTPTDLDIYLMASDGAGGFVVVAAAATNNIGGDPVEILGPITCSNPHCVGFIMIVQFSGPTPGRMKYVIFPSGGNPSLSPAISSGTLYGHANAKGAIAVGAANYKTPTTLESFSSGGTTPVLFDTDGNLLAPGADPRQFKPEIVAPDFVDTTFLGFDTDSNGFPNFGGTSAAAPHAAGVAALLLQALPSLTSTDVRNILETTALNMGPAGFDTNTGFGLIRADVALNALHVFSITGPTGDPNPVIQGGTVSLSVTASDSFGHTLTYAWTSTCTGGLPPGSFDDAGAPVTAWTAPLNSTGVSQTCALKVTVNDGHGFTRTGTHSATVVSVPRVTSVAPSPSPVDSTVTIVGTSLAGATSVTFAGPVTVSPTVVTSTSVKVMVPAGARTGVLSVATPAGVGPSLSLFRVAPKIATVLPGTAVGGSEDLVTVTGTNLRALTGAQTVKVGTTTVPPGLIQSSTPTELQFRVPLGAVNAKISVTTVDGTTLSAATLLVSQPPRATSFSPNPAPVGALLTITGTNLLNVAEVTFAGGVTALPIGIPTATSLKVMVPPGAVTGPVTLTNPIGTTTSTVNFRLAPKIDLLTPDTAVGGSTIVTVTGTNLRALTGTPTVKVGATTVPPGQVGGTANALTFSVPLGALTAKVSVTTVDGTATSPGNLTVTQPPRATGFSPNPAPVGTPLTITGTNLTGATLVTFSGVGAVTVVPTDITLTSLKVVVPPDAVTGPVTVTNGSQSSTSTVNFRVAPKITTVLPGTAVGGSEDLVTVTGTNLMAQTGTQTVKVGTTTVPPGLIKSNTPTELVFKVPLGAVTAKVSVTTVDGTALSPNTLLVTQPPRATGFSPNPAPVGALLTITGTNLTGATLVTFSGVGAVTVVPTDITLTSLKVVVPPDAVTGPVTVTNGSQSSTSTVNFRVAPKIESFTPDTAVGGSPTIVDVTGTNLLALSGALTVKVGTMTVPPSLISGSTPTLLQFTVPLGAGSGKISVTTVDGTALSPNTLLVTQPPRATGFSPNPAPVGTPLTITGTNLTGATLVTFSGVGAVTVVPTDITLTSLKVVVPPDAVTGPVTVTNGSQSSTSTVNFRVAPKIATVLPGTAVGGSEDLVTVTGTNLVAQTGTQTVKVGTTTVPPGLIQSNTPIELVFKVPLGAVTAKVSVTTVDGTALSALNLTVQQPPRAAAFSPNPAPVGTLLTITGTNLLGVTEVAFTGGVTAVPIGIPTATSLKVTVPDGAVTGPVTVTNGIGATTSTAIFKLLPKITGFTPPVAPLDSAVVVNGTNLQTGGVDPVVKVGTVAAVVVASSPTEVTFTVPALAVTGKITITTADGTATTATALTVLP